MKEKLCILFKEAISDSGLSFAEFGKLSGMSKTQVNNIVNHKGKEVSMEKIMNGLTLVGYEINLSIWRK